MDDFPQISNNKIFVPAENNKVIEKLINEVREVKQSQNALTSKFTNLQSENELIWRQYASLRQKFNKQHEIINKVSIYSFLIYL